jgi:hypothetical protein
MLERGGAGAHRDVGELRAYLRKSFAASRGLDLCSASTSGRSGYLDRPTLERQLPLPIFDDNADAASVA